MWANGFFFSLNSHFLSAKLQSQKNIKFFDSNSFIIIVIVSHSYRKTVYLYILSKKNRFYFSVNASRMHTTNQTSHTFVCRGGVYLLSITYCLSIQMVFLIQSSSTRTNWYFYKYDFNIEAYLQYERTNREVHSSGRHTNTRAHQPTLMYAHVVYGPTIYSVRKRVNTYAAATAVNVSRARFGQ